MEGALMGRSSAKMGDSSPSKKRKTTRSNFVMKTKTSEFSAARSGNCCSLEADSQLIALFSIMACQPAPGRDIQYHNLLPPSVEHPKHAPSEQGVRGEGVGIPVQGRRRSIQAGNLWHIRSSRYASQRSLGSCNVTR